MRQLRYTTRMIRNRINAVGILGMLVFSMSMAVAPIAAQAACCKCYSSSDVKLNICIEQPAVGTCENLPQKSTNPEVKALTCETEQNDSNCKVVPEGGICFQKPVSEELYAPVKAKATTTVKEAGIDLNVDIPGLELAQTVEQREGYVSIPWLAQYVSGVQRYLIGISAVAAAIMMVYGGFRYLVGGTTGDVQKGKAVIRDALIGLVLMLGAYTILSVVNPKLVQLDAIQVTVVEREVHTIPEGTYQALHEVARVSGYEPDPEIAERLKKIEGGTIPATRHYPENPFDSRMVFEPEAMAEIVDLITEKVGLSDRCIAHAIIAIESGGRQNAIGHDEDAALVQVQARLNFLRSGKKKSGATFSPPSDLPDNCTAEVKKQCERAVKATRSIRNDDTITAEPPEFGLDWRFSHGLGLTQLTVFSPGTAGFCKDASGAYGLKAFDTCWSVAALLTLEGQVELTIQGLKNIKERGATTPCNFFNGWAGSSPKNGGCYGLVARKMKAYQQCTLQAAQQK